MVQLYGLPTRDGTCASETVICSSCIEKGEKQKLIIPPDCNPYGDFVNVTLNDAVQCNICGAKVNR